MILKIDDWEFDIDLDRTRDHAIFAAEDHCTCGYCENYYRAVQLCYPDLKPFLGRFGLKIDGPVEMYPIEPTLYLSGYRVTGRILRFGIAPIMVDGIPVRALPAQDGYFMLEVGQMPLPWLMLENPEDVVSPANEPEFLLKMYSKIRGTSFEPPVNS